MRKYLDISLKAFVAITLAVAMLWPLEAPQARALRLPAGPDGPPGASLNVNRCKPAFGGLIELIQPTLNRSADVKDWIADILGVVIGIPAGLLYRQLRQH